LGAAGGVAMDVPTALWPHEVSVAPRWRGAMIPLIDPILVGEVLAHEVAFDVVDAPLETVAEPKLKIDAAKKSAKEFLKLFTVPLFKSTLETLGSAKKI
jgi:hypothetical protein